VHNFINEDVRNRTDKGMTFEKYSDSEARWQRLMMLRQQHEVVRRRLSGRGLSSFQREQFHDLLRDFEQEMESIENARRLN
jgi:hypothetical protein